ncbi:MAG: REP element-mobilizing transposase RayT [Candidatus Azotimanducaceae bacterium]|jgi:putative transposase
MSRPVRIEFPGANYYVTSKGNGEKAVFRDDEDRAVFLNVIDTVVSRLEWIIHSYVLMGNHYHLVVECPNANLSKGMRQLNGVYTQYFNRRHGVEGPLFKGRFKSILFEKQSYLLLLCRHAVLSPVRSEAVTSPQKYRWSSYRAHIGLVKPLRWLCTDTLLGQFGKREKDNQRKYRDFVKLNTHEPSPLEGRAAQVLLGSPAFVEEMQPILNGEKVAKRGPRAVKRRRSLSSLCKNVENKAKDERNKVIRRAHIDHAYTLKEIGDYLGLHYTTVSKVVNQ